MSSFSDWLNAQMTERGWSQSELARRSGLTRQAINYYLGDKSKEPDKDAVYKLARALKLPPMVVLKASAGFPSDPESDELSERADHIIKNYKYPETKEKALEYLEFLAIQEEKSEYRASPSSKPAKGSHSK